MDTTTCDFLGDCQDFTLQDVLDAPNQTLMLVLDTEDERRNSGSVSEPWAEGSCSLPLIGK